MSVLKTYSLLLVLFFTGSEFEAESKVRDPLNYNLIHYTLCEDACNCSNTGQSLEIIATNSTEEDDVHIDIMSPHLYLNKSVSFVRLHSLTISGDPSSGTNISCNDLNSHAGIILKSVLNVTLNRLTLAHCGSLLDMGKRNYSSALILISCGDIYVRNLVITRSQGIGLVILNHQQGTVHIGWSHFTENKIPKEFKDQIYGGGGVYVGEFQQRHKWTIIFEYCVFDKNIAYTREYRSFYTNEFGKPQEGFGRGGGIFVALENRMWHSQVSILVSSCMFKENQAFLGGGFAVNIGGRRMQHNTTTITITIENSVFDSNGCTITGMGGGAHLSYDTFNSINMIAKYKLQNLSFTKNCAQLGGGIFFFSHKRSSGANNSKSLLFDNCTFERNSAHIGSAIDLTPHIFERLSTDHIAIVPVFKNCMFMHNYNMDLENSEFQGVQTTPGTGTLFASLYDIKFEGSNSFENNNGTAIHIVNGKADFSKSNATFKNNKGVQGGAIALIGLSSMIVGPNREYMFVNNEAEFQGGALYVQMIDTHDFSASKSCFIQYFDGTLNKSWESKIEFSGNKAPVGRAIFATSLHPCQSWNNYTDIFNRSYYTAITATDVFLLRGINVNISDVATDGAVFHNDVKELYVIPGKRYDHGVTIMDDTKQIVNETLRVNVENNTRVMLDPGLSSYVRKKIQMVGKPGKANITLSTVSTRQTYTTLEIVLGDCPPGFKLQMDKCECDTNNYYGLVGCQDFQSYMIPGLWAGLITDEISNKEELATSICPHRFCNYSLSLMLRNKQTRILKIALPQNTSQLDEIICNEAREGILCGKCRPGYTVHFHSPSFLCKSTDRLLCKLGWMFYIFSEFVPITVVFITVLVLNISFTSGAANGFILFSQVLLSLNIDARGIIKFPIAKAYHRRVSVCLWFPQLRFLHY